MIRCSTMLIAYYFCIWLLEYKYQNICIESSFAYDDDWSRYKYVLEHVPVLHCTSTHNTDLQIQVLTTNAIEYSRFVFLDTNNETKKSKWVQKLTFEKREGNTILERTKNHGVGKRHFSSCHNFLPLLT